MAINDDEIILSTENAKVRIMFLDENGSVNWHSHTEVTDNMFCLEGEITVETRDPDNRYRLKPGQRCTVPAGRIHRVVNTSPGKSRYLLVQGGGAYDFNPEHSLRC